MINNENSYYAKYLKYKKKYLDLKQLIGGQDDKELVETQKKAVDVLIKSIGAALYIRSFKKIHDKSYCRAILDESYQEIGKFDNDNIIIGTEIELEKFKEINSKWRNMTFGEIKRSNMNDIEEYCKLYNEENKSVLDDDANLFGEFDDTITKDRIQEKIQIEDKENNVTNLFSA